ncbi:restriction endonuclease subunit S [Desulfovibrio mangrovi]|uniref:restriction endonuclease subunit S n=1 Tax=Desulfovibrio mangrovi TaxID=2976983 RepID=UPI002245993F|nr:restriction endonuclease subunit S [Desulfovibrio mangrovi]UZP66005.1 restriction endonuclease subunit S [Desulfovibrio mangrovi]
MTKQADKGTWSCNQLPPTWVWASFNALFSDTTSSHKKLKQKDYDEDGSLPVIDQGASLIGGTTHRSELQYDEELPVIIFGDHTRCVKFVDFNFAQGADGVKVLRLFQKLYSKFFYHALKTVTLPDKGYSRHFKFLRATEFPLPPLNEQRRIADKIDALQAKSRRAREALETVKPLLEKFRQSVLAAAFRGDLTAEWRKQNPNVEPASKLLERIRAERRARWEEAELAKMQAKGVKPKNDKWKEKYEEPAPVDTEGLPELPEGWCWASTSESCAIVVDCHNKTAPYKEDGIPLIRTTNVRNGKINLSATMFVDEPTYQYWSRRCIPLPGDIIFTREAPMCEVGMIPEEVMLCMGQRMMLLRADDNNLRKNFLLYALQAPHIIEFAQRVGVGMGVKHLRVRDVENLPIPLAPIAEQKQLEIILTRTIELHEKLLEIVEGTSSPLNDLDQSILAKAFRGELVPQDPNDEPASVLLERIKAEREAAPGKKKRGRRAS